MRWHTGDLNVGLRVERGDPTKSSTSPSNPLLSLTSPPREAGEGKVFGTFAITLVRPPMFRRSLLNLRQPAGELRGSDACLRPNPVCWHTTLSMCDYSPKQHVETSSFSVSLPTSSPILPLSTTRNSNSALTQSAVKITSYCTERIPNSSNSPVSSRARCITTLGVSASAKVLVSTS